jgi:heme-degrading monooxygenase HmoA
MPESEEPKEPENAQAKKKKDHLILDIWKTPQDFQAWKTKDEKSKRKREEAKHHVEPYRIKVAYPQFSHLADAQAEREEKGAAYAGDILMDDLLDPEYNSEHVEAIRADPQLHFTVCLKLWFEFVSFGVAKIEGEQIGTGGS